MRKTQLIKKTILTICVILIVILSFFIYSAYRFFNPVPLLIKDSNSISSAMYGSFGIIDFGVPQSLANVYEYDSRELFADEFLRFSITNNKEYMSFKYDLLKRLEPQQAQFPANYSKRDMERIERWWTPPVSDAYKLSHYYIGFDDNSQTVYFYDKCSD
ncbi:MAG: hypothetical protein JXA96_06815 [Sedimentisphaerales bacterium]|nr:hypothetical protein [Sedimentisphaerales bacterium]